MVSNNFILVKVEKFYFETIFHSKESEAGSSVLQYSQCVTVSVFLYLYVCICIEG